MVGLCFAFVPLNMVYCIKAVCIINITSLTIVTNVTIVTIVTNVTLVTIIISSTDYSIVDNYRNYFDSNWSSKEQTLAK